MWWYRSCLLILVGSCLVLLTATLARPSASADPAPAAVRTIPAPPANPQPSADAEQCLDQAVAALAPEHLSWLETAIWQKVELPGYAYEADGRYRLGPDHRFRLELRTHVGEAEGTFLMVSDGRNLWEASRAGEEPWENVRRLDLTEVFAVLDGPGASPLRDEFLQRPHFRGLTPLLRHLRSRLVWMSREPVRRGSAEQIRLVGAWSRETLADLAPSHQPWPAGLPRQCHLYLNPHTLWPERIEWWGPTGQANGETLTAQMEFRGPVFNRPLPADACARLFSFQPGTAEVKDETASVTADYTARARELTAETTASP